MSDGFGLKIGVEGEREFKKSLAEINQTFKVLGSEMKLVQSQFDKNDNSVEALTARNATLNKQIDNQKEKISTLKAALENAASSFGENDRRTQAWQIQLNNAQAALNKMERELSQNDQALDSVGDEFSKAEKKADKFGDEVKETGEQAESSGAKFKKVGEVLKTVGVAMAAATAAIGTAAVAAGKKLWDMASETAKAGDEIDKTSQKLGMSAEAYQEWDYVLSQSGVEITSMTTGLKTLTNQIDDAKNGSTQAQARFAKLGISLNDLSTMSREDVFAAVVSGMQGMADTTERAALANDLFGKSGQNLLAHFCICGHIRTSGVEDNVHSASYLACDNPAAFASARACRQNQYMIPDARSSFTAGISPELQSFFCHDRVKFFLFTVFRDHFAVIITGYTDDIIVVNPVPFFDGSGRTADHFAVFQDILSLFKCF